MLISAYMAARAVRDIDERAAIRVRRVRRFGYPAGELTWRARAPHRGWCRHPIIMQELADESKRLPQR
jgi:hypothetical protein